MKPYYQDDAVTIYHADCRELLPMRCDAIITDPPYGTGFYQTDTAVFDHTLLSTLVTMAPCAVFGWPERLVALCVDAHLKPDEWITWWPTNAAVKAVPCKGLARESECLGIFGHSRFDTLREVRGRPLIFTTVRPGDRGRGKSHGDPTYRRLGDVWRDPAPGIGFQSHRRQHPNEKAIGVMSRLVEGLTILGSKVLDPFAGSGTTLVAAKILGRSAVGIEIEERYCEVAAKRCQQEVLALGTVA